MANPWGKFFWADWESDPALKLCSFAAQGLWMRMLCIAAAHDPIGLVAVNGRALDAQALARMTGGLEPEVTALLAELAEHGVFSVDRHGRIYSRRMIRDAKVSKERSKAGAVGASVTNGKRYGNSDLPQQNPGKGSANASAKARPQKPEARSQKPESLSRTEVGERRARTNDPPLNANLAAVMKAGGMISPPPDAHLVREWLALPGMELERDIIPIVARVAERKRERDSRPPFKLLLFDAAVREHHATEQAEIERLRRIPMQIAETERLQREADEAEERERRAAVGR